MLSFDFVNQRMLQFVLKRIIGKRPFSSVFRSDASRAITTIVTKKRIEKLIFKQPNYFIGVQIDNDEVIDNLKQVQNEMISFHPELKSVLVPIKNAHVTLLVFHLDEEHCLHDAKEAMQNAFEEFRAKNICSFDLTIEGVDNFKNDVVYAKILDDAGFQNLCKMFDIFQELFEKEGIMSQDNRRFSPHLTLAKMSKDFGLRKKGIRKIDRKSYSQHIGRKFGVQRIQTFQLLSMLKPKNPENGYYHCVSAWRLGDS